MILDRQDGLKIGSKPENIHSKSWSNWAEASYPNLVDRFGHLAGPQDLVYKNLDDSKKICTQEVHGLVLPFWFPSSNGIGIL